MGEKRRSETVYVINHTDRFRRTARSCGFAVGYPTEIVLHPSERHKRPDASRYRDVVPVPCFFPIRVGPNVITQQQVINHDSRPSN
jgi:hypothetical protein